MVLLSIMGKAGRRNHQSLVTSNPFKLAMCILRTNRVANLITNRVVSS